jgi:hypothetical protein
MILLMLFLGIASIFSSGVLFNIFLNKQTRSDLFISIIGFVAGLFILISMIGAII